MLCPGTSTWENITKWKSIQRSWPTPSQNVSRNPSVKANRYAGGPTRLKRKPPCRRAWETTKRLAGKTRVELQNYDANSMRHVMRLCTAQSHVWLCAPGTRHRAWQITDLSRQAETILPSFRLQLIINKFGRDSQLRGGCDESNFKIIDRVHLDSRVRLPRKIDQYSLMLFLDFTVTRW